jgi:uncharacterized DUF497 family protein/DNA-binding MarR family transcriptional regulator/DNA-binding transcriptional regulator YiaG
MNAPTTADAAAANDSATAKARLRLWLRILKVQRLLERELRERLRIGFETTLPRFDVLAALHRAGTELTMGELSGVLRVSNGNVTGIVDRLVGDGLVVRVPVEGDRRALAVRLSAKGATHFTELAKAHEAWVSDLLGSVDRDDATALSAELAVIARRSMPGGWGRRQLACKIRGDLSRIDKTNGNQYLMQDDEFEWDDTKAALNESDHGVSFEMAGAAFGDPFAIERIDRRHKDPEERFALLGMVDNRLLFVSYAQRGERIRVMSARKAEPHERRRYHNETARFDWSRADAMTDEEVHAAAIKDTDARPMTDAEWDAAPKVPRTKTLRRALGLTQEEFSARFQIPLGTLRDWEQGKTEPDQSARAYLRAIAGDAAAVQRALEAVPKPR